MEFIKKCLPPYEVYIFWKPPNKLCLCILMLYSLLILIYHLYVMQHDNLAGYIQNHRRTIVNAACVQNNLNNSRYSIAASQSLFVEHYHKLIYCEVPKVGCSNWKRVIIVLKFGFLHHPEDLKHKDVHENRLLNKLSEYSVDQQKEMLNKYTKVMFSRHPFQRLVSAYRDKILHPKAYYTNVVRSIKYIIRGNRNLESNVTFEEFVRFLLQEDPRKMDIHWRPMHHLCDPCNIQYDIYGKFETINLDADYVLRSIRAPSYLKYPSIKEYPDESRTDQIISRGYFESLSMLQLQGLAKIYHFDFVMFNYKNIYNINEATVHKLSST